MGVPIVEKDIWHRDIRGTEWMNGKGSWVVRFVLLVAGISDLGIATMGLFRGWFASSAKWMGVGPWFQYELAFQNALVGVVALVCASYWLRSRQPIAVLRGVLIGCSCIFIGPSHAPTEGSDGNSAWFRYAVTVVVLILGYTYALSEWRKSKA